MAEIHLICNAHIDPVWQWEWEEGAAVALSTFRSAVRFCEEYDDLIFCHNEAMLYQWIEDYEPALFQRIQKLVRAGKWHIMGGWYLQPDCNMPCGESIIRHMQMGQSYFEEKFGKRSTTAVSFDAFGHNRGLVQLLTKAGYDSYLFMRPFPKELTLPDNSFIWVGYDGSEVMAWRLGTGYNNRLGRAAEKVSLWMDNHPDRPLSLVTWGVGNHGGGPSRKDIEDINALRASHAQSGLRHSTPEAFFDALRAQKDGLQRFSSSLTPWGVGSYTSQIRIKQQHRLLESMLDQTERMTTHAFWAGLSPYPTRELAEAAHDLCLSEFHDILSGTCTQPAEESALRLMHHGQEILARLRLRAFIALAREQAPAAPGEIPILVYNPFPYKVEQDIECEFWLADQNRTEDFFDIVVCRDGREIPSQLEKEHASLPIDWAKHVVFHAELEPMQMNRFDCKVHVIPAKVVSAFPEKDGKFTFDNGRLHVEIDCATGYMRSYQVDGFEYLRDAAMKLLVMQDTIDPWGMRVDRYRDVIGEFALMDERDSARFAGVYKDALPAVRVVENGPIRTVVEAVFRYRDSCAVVRYKLPATGCAVDVEVRLTFLEKDQMVKLSIPTVLDGEYLGQSIFGIEEQPADGRECVAQQWTAVRAQGRMVSFINNGVYGSDCCGGEIRASLLHTTGYAAHPIGEAVVLPQDRFSPRAEQGERLYRFVLEGGAADARLNQVGREAQAVNETPYVLSYFPPKDQGAHTSALSLEGDGVQLTALRPCADGDGFLVRLFESTGTPRTAKLTAPLCQAQAEVALKGFEVLTLRVNPKTGEILPANLLD